MQENKQPFENRIFYRSRHWFRWVLSIVLATVSLLFVIEMFHRFKIRIPGITKKGTRRRPAAPTASPVPPPPPPPPPPPKRRPTKYNLCVVSRVRNVPSLIPSWIEFNTLIGIQHFFIADDCSNDGNSTHYWLKFYEKAGLMTPFFTQPMNNCSSPQWQPDEAYLLNYVVEYVRNHALCAWIGVIDPDEYIVPVSNASLHLFTSNPANVNLSLPWLLMGHNAQQFEKNESKLSNFLCGVWDSVYTKTFAREEIIREWRSSHFPYYYDTKPIGNNSGQTKSFEFLTENGCDKIPSHGLSLRHYQYLSFQEHMKTRGNRKHNSFGELHGHQNWSISQHYAKWLMENRNYSCTRCGRKGESNALSLAKQLNEQIVRKYSTLVHNPEYHIYRGIPFP